MRNSINELYDTFNNGEFKLAFAGNDKLKLVDHTWGGYDTLLVFTHLFKWLKDGNETPENLRRITLEFEAKVINDQSINPISRGLESLKFVLSYCIVANDKNFWPITKDFIKRLIAQVQTRKERLGPKNVDQDIEEIEKYLQN